MDTGHFDTIRDSLAGVSNDRRIQVVMIAFVFGALLEATAGFGTPMAITGSLLAGPPRELPATLPGPGF